MSKPSRNYVGLRLTDRMYDWTEAAIDDVKHTTVTGVIRVALQEYLERVTRVAVEGEPNIIKFEVTDSFFDELALRMDPMEHVDVHQCAKSLLAKYFKDSQ
tara:strand:- start:234 stop:536 length:303 start_codon:yes stop_codon:yes gene_type:complete